MASLRKYRLGFLGHDLWRVEKLDRGTVATDAQDTAIHAAPWQMDAFRKSCKDPLQAGPHNVRSTQGSFAADGVLPRLRQFVRQERDYAKHSTPTDTCMGPSWTLAPAMDTGFLASSDSTESSRTLTPTKRITLKWPAWSSSYAAVLVPTWWPTPYAANCRTTN